MSLHTMSVIVYFLEARGEVQMTEDGYFECPEISGKTVRRLRIYRNGNDGVEAQIDLTDGTSFSWAVSLRPTVRANLFRGGVGIPKTIRDYEL
jgi:hypothetical protein